MIYNKPGGFLGDCIRIDNNNNINNNNNNNNNNNMFGTRWDPTPQKSQLTKFPHFPNQPLHWSKSRPNPERSKVVQLQVVGVYFLNPQGHSYPSKIEWDRIPTDPEM